MTALTVAQRIADEVGIPRPGTLTGTTDQNARRLLAMINASGRRIMRRHDWRVLQKEATFTTVSGYDQGTLTSLASDIDRARIVADTMWNRTQNDQIIGPVTPEEYQDEQSGVSASVVDRYYLRGTHLFLLPSATAGETVAFEYISKYWAQDTNGSGIDIISADTDDLLIDEELVILDACWRYNRAGGFEWEAQQLELEAMLKQAIAVDRPGKRLHLGMSRGLIPGQVRYPDGDWSAL
jgi:hypothetical protein